MSNKVSFLYVAKNKFSAVSNRIAKSSTRARKKFRELRVESNKLNKAQKRLALTQKKTAGSFSSSMRSMAASILAFIGVRKLLDIGTGFQDAVADLSAITGATGKDLKFFSDESLRLGKKTVTAQSEVATAFKLVASAKSELLKDPKALSNVTEQVLLLKNATGIDLVSATKVATESLNQFGAGAERANEFVNILAAGSKIGASEVFETGAAVVKSGVAAKLAGVSFVELNALIQVLAKNGIKADLAGTQLKTTLLKLETTGTKKFMPSVVGMSKALENLGKANLSTEEKSKLFGLEAISAGNILIENVSLFKDWTKAMTGTNIAQQQADIRMSTLSTKMRKMGIILKGAVIKTFERLEPVIGKQIISFSKFFENLDEKQIDGFAKSLKGLLTVAGFIVDAFKVVLAVFKGVGTAIGELVAQIATLNFTEGLGTDIKEAFSIGGKLFGIFDNENKIKDNLSPQKNIEGITSQSQQSRTDVNVNLRAPEGAVESVKSMTTGKVSGMNVGVNMATAL